MSTVSFAIIFNFSIFSSFEIFSVNSLDALLTVDCTKTSASSAMTLLISKFKIPIVSISSSKDDEKILLVSYNENQSEIIKLEKDDNFNKSDGIKIFNIETIKKPIQENMNYLYGILDPSNSERFLLIGRNQSKNFNNDKEIINRKNLARVFVLNDQSNDRVEGEFVMYRNIEDNYLYNNPEYFKLIMQYYAILSRPAIINTSFKIRVIEFVVLNKELS